MSKIKVAIDSEEFVFLETDNHGNFSLKVNAYQVGAGEDDESICVNILLDQFQMHEFLIKAKMLFNQEIK